MKLAIRILGIVLCLSIVFSCKKQSDDDGSNGTKLSKVIVWTSYQSNPVIAINKYHYDALNRVTEIAYSNGDSAIGESGAKFVNSQKWFYNGDEQLPYKSTDINDSAVLNKKYYFYDYTGRLVRDSSSNTVRTYNWFPDWVMIANDSLQINSHNYLARLGSNYPIGLGRPVAFWGYDNKVNPLHTLNIHAALAFDQTGGIPTVGYSENNITEFKTGNIALYGIQHPYDITPYRYNYNAHDLPVDCEIGGRYPGKIKFYYTN